MSIIKSRLSLIITISILFVLWLFAPIRFTPLIFIKNESLRSPYTFLFFSILFLVTALIQKNIQKMSWIKAILFLGIIGQTVSIVALVLAQMVEKNNFEKLINSFQKLSVADILIAQLISPFLLCGWLAAIVLCACIKFRNSSRN